MLSVFLVLVVTLDSFLCRAVNTTESQNYCVINTGRCEYRIELHDHSSNETAEMQSELQSKYNELNSTFTDQIALLQQFSVEKQSLIKRVDALGKELQSIKQQCSCNGSDNQGLGACMAAGNGCPEDFIPFRQSCYGFSKFATSHNEALKHCSYLYGSHLVHVADKEVLYFIRWNNPMEDSPDMTFWSGATIINGTWVWGHDRSPLTNNILVRINTWLTDSNIVNSCSVIDPSRYELRAVRCSRIKRMICEKNRFSL